MKYFIFFLSLLFGQHLMSQDYLQHIKIEKLKRNFVGLDISMGQTSLSTGQSKFSYAGGINYSRVSKSGRVIFEFGGRFTQLNIKNSGKTKSPSSPDTLLLGTNFRSFFDVPITIKVNFPLNDKTNLMINSGFFYSTYIKHIRRTDYFLSSDESFVDRKNIEIKHAGDFLIGFQIGFGVSHQLTHKFSIQVNANHNLRAEPDVFGNSFYFPNITFGARQRF